TAIRDALADNFLRAEIIFVTGGLGPTTDDITREITAQLLGLELVFDPAIATSITERLRSRAIRLTDRVLRQAQVPRGAEVLPNAYVSAPGLYLAASLNPAIATPHLFLLPGPPRELQPMFREAAVPILKRIVRRNESIGYCNYRIVGMGESYVEEAVGSALLE